MCQNSWPHSYPFHPCIDFKFATLYDEHSSMVCWSLAKLFTRSLIHSCSSLQLDCASCYRLVMIQSRHIWNYKFLFNAHMNSFLLSNQGSHTHGHPNFLCFDIHTMYAKFSEGPPSSMDVPLSYIYENMHFLEAIPCNVLTMSTFILIEPVPATTV